MLLEPVKCVWDLLIKDSGHFTSERQSNLIFIEKYWPDQ